ncbi:hypothetical protein DXG01_004636, partial [Tephrocybe rancida]
GDDQIPGLTVDNPHYYSAHSRTPPIPTSDPTLLGLQRLEPRDFRPGSATQDHATSPAQHQACDKPVVMGDLEAWCKV